MPSAEELAALRAASRAEFLKKRAAEGERVQKALLLEDQRTLQRSAFDEAETERQRKELDERAKRQ